MRKRQNAELDRLGGWFTHLGTNRARRRLTLLTRDQRRYAVRQTAGHYTTLDGSGSAVIPVNQPVSQSPARE